MASINNSRQALFSKISDRSSSIFCAGSLYASGPVRSAIQCDRTLFVNFIFRCFSFFGTRREASVKITSFGACNEKWIARILWNFIVLQLSSKTIYIPPLWSGLQFPPLPSCVDYGKIFWTLLNAPSLKLPKRGNFRRSLMNKTRSFSIKAITKKPPS